MLKVDLMIPRNAWSFHSLFLTNLAMFSSIQNERGNRLCNSIFLKNKSSKFSKRLSPHCSPRFSSPTSCPCTFRHACPQSLWSGVLHTESRETNPRGQFSFLSVCTCSIISIELLPNWDPLCHSLTISPHTLPKGTVLTSYCFSNIPYYPNSFYVCSWI